MSLWTEGALQNWLTVGVLMVVVGGLIAKEAVEERDRESTVYRSIKISFWWLLGVTIGVYFQARLNLKERMKGVIEVVLYGLFIGVTVYTLFTVGDLVKEYF
jgi:cell division protein FtsW (lipid II flippase)